MPTPALKPHEGREKLRDLDAVPAKDILKNKARVCPPLPAICEILDNIFDNYEEAGASHDLSVSITAKSDDDGEISIAENSGGIRESKLEPLVRLGVAYHAARGSIGTWGEGFKVAAFSLGAEVEVETHFPGEPPVSVHFDRGWLESPDWKVPVYSLKDSAPKPGTTIFRIRHINRSVDWADVMREISVIYGHKIQAITDAGHRVRLDFEVNGKRTTITPRPLASLEYLRRRFAFPPDFSPRQFTATWHAEHGIVKCRLIVGLTPRHSGETSGVYMYGNGRMFARALRSRAVGYGESGNAILRDHPSCWRIHAYAFFDADNGADIPWQAPLKDGVSENHIITQRFREMFREVVSPYSRFAKIAKASELVPFSAEWEGLDDERRAEVLFRSKVPQAIEQTRALPQGILEFTPPREIEAVRVDGVAGEELVKKLDRHAQYVRQIIKKRDEKGPALEVDVLRSLNPSAFAEEASAFDTQRRHKLFTAPPKKTRITIEVEPKRLDTLKTIFGTATDGEAISMAISFAIRNRASHKTPKRVRKQR